MHTLNGEEKIILIGIVVGILFMCSLIFFTGCTSNRKHDIDGTLINHQQEIDRLEEELRSRDRTIENAIRELRTITSRSESMEGTVDEVIELFGEYHRRVEQMLYDYERIRNHNHETEGKTESKN